jgi:ribosomal protein S18 acetylase RimI-like enzyme
MITLLIQNIEINDELTNASHGQKDLIKFAELKGKPIGYLQYADFEGVPSIKHIAVNEKYRRQGIATKLINELQKGYPDKKIDWGMLTPEGIKLKKAIAKKEGGEIECQI